MGVFAVAYLSMTSCAAIERRPLLIARLTLRLRNSWRITRRASTSATSPALAARASAAASAANLRSLGVPSTGVSWATTEFWRTTRASAGKLPTGWRPRVPGDGSASSHTTDAQREADPPSLRSAAVEAQRARRALPDDRRWHESAPVPAIPDAPGGSGVQRTPRFTERPTYAVLGSARDPSGLNEAVLPRCEDPTDPAFGDGSGGFNDQRLGHLPRGRSNASAAWVWASECRWIPQRPRYATVETVIDLR